MRLPCPLKTGVSPRMSGSTMMRSLEFMRPVERNSLRFVNLGSSLVL